MSLLRKYRRLNNIFLLLSSLGLLVFVVLATITYNAKNVAFSVTALTIIDTMMLISAAALFTIGSFRPGSFSSDGFEQEWYEKFLAKVKLVAVLYIIAGIIFIILTVIKYNHINSGVVISFL